MPLPTGLRDPSTSWGFLTDRAAAFQAPLLWQPSAPPPPFPAIRWAAALLMSLLHSERASGITAGSPPPSDLSWQQKYYSDDFM